MRWPSSLARGAMMRAALSLALLAALLAASALLTGCGGGGDDEPAAPDMTIIPVVCPASGPLCK